MGGIGRGLSLCRAPGAACRAQEWKILLNKGSPARKDKQVGAEGRLLGWFYGFLQGIISEDVEISPHLPYRLEEITGTTCTPARHWTPQILLLEGKHEFTAALDWIPNRASPLFKKMIQLWVICTS